MKNSASRLAIGALAMFLVGPLAVIVLAVALSDSVNHVVRAAPYTWVAPALGAVLVLVSSSVKRKGFIVLACNIAVMMVFLGICEGITYAWFVARDEISNKRKIVNKPEGAHSEPHEVLGYGPRPDAELTREEYAHNELLYSVTYTIEPNGLRLAPPSKGEPTQAIVFFGGSFTFGQGVADEANMPYVVGSMTGGRYAVYNFGYPGYGPHQMLAALQAGYADELVEERPVRIVYQAIIPHIRRAAGLNAWDPNGPRFILSPDNRLMREGYFNDPLDAAEGSAGDAMGVASSSKRQDTRASRVLDYARDKSYIIQQWRDYKRRSAYANPDHISLFLSIVEEAGRFVELQYPDSEFHVIFWDRHDFPGSRDIADELETRGLRVHRISRVLPKYYTLENQLNRFDRHPSPEAYSAIATYIVENILGPGGDA